LHILVFERVFYDSFVLPPTSIYISIFIFNQFLFLHLFFAVKNGVLNFQGCKEI